MGGAPWEPRLGAGGAGRGVCVKPSNGDGGPGKAAGQWRPGSAAGPASCSRTASPRDSSHTTRFPRFKDTVHWLLVCPPQSRSGHFHWPRRNRGPLEVVALALPPLPLQACIYFLSLRICLFRTFSTNGITRSGGFRDWFLSPCMTFPRFTVSETGSVLHLSRG